MLSVDDIRDRILTFVFNNAGCSPIQLAIDIASEIEASLDLPTMLEDLVNAGNLVEVQYASDSNYYNSLLFDSESYIEVFSSNKHTNIYCDEKVIKSFDNSVAITIIRKI